MMRDVLTAIKQCTEIAFIITNVRLGLRSLCVPTVVVPKACGHVAAMTGWA